MSHFALIVIGDDYKEQLKPFDERLEMPRYVAKTKAQIINDERKAMEDYKNGRYAEYLQDPTAYASTCNNDGHLNYLKNEFPRKLQRTDEEIYQDEIKYEEAENIGENGEIYSTYNPNSKWDWYSLGGRYSGKIKLKEGATGLVGTSGAFGNKTGIDQAKKGDIANLGEITTFAVLKDGEWYERGKMGWWGMVSNEQDETEWATKVQQLLSELPDDTTITIVDCHI